MTTSSSLESDLALFCSFLVWENAAPKAMPILIPIPKLLVAAPIPIPIANPTKNFNEMFQIRNFVKTRLSFELLCGKRRLTL